jgi:hypothetical protein
MPQHRTAPSARPAQVWSSPVTSRASDVPWDVTGDGLNVVVPVPS